MRDDELRRVRTRFREVGSRSRERYFARGENITLPSQSGNGLPMQATSREITERELGFRHGLAWYAAASGASAMAREILAST